MTNKLTDGFLVSFLNDPDAYGRDALIDIACAAVAEVRSLRESVAYDTGYLACLVDVIGWNSEAQVISPDAEGKVHAFIDAVLRSGDFIGKGVPEDCAETVRHVLRRLTKRREASDESEVGGG